MSKKTHGQAGLYSDVRTEAGCSGGDGRVSRLRNTGGGGRRPVKAKSAACDPQPAANTGQAPTGKNVFTHPAIKQGNGIKPDEFSASSTHRKKQRLQGRSSRSESSAVVCRAQREAAVTDKSKNILFLINHYPKVTLCDVAKSCHSCRCNCSYTLPDALGSRSVRCFKRDMRAGFRFSPGCFGENKHESNQKTLYTNYPGVESERNVCQSVTENKEHFEHLDSQRLSNHVASRFHWRTTSQDTATSDSSVFNTHASKAEGGAGRDVGDCFGSCSNPTGAQTHKEKRVKLGNGINTSSTFGSTVKENCVTKELSGWIGEVTRTHGAQMSSEHEDEMATEDPRSFTCQRVRVYQRKMHFLCARTYMPWPFANSNTTGRSQVSSSASSSGPVDPSARNQSNSKAQPDPLCNQIKDVFSYVSADAQKINCGNCDSVTSHPDAATDAYLCSSLSANGPEDDASVSTSCSAARGPTDWETSPTLSPVSPPFSQSCLSSLSATPSDLPPATLHLKSLQGIQSRAGEKPSFHSEETQRSLCSSSYSPVMDSSDSCSSFLVLKDEHSGDERVGTDGSLPNLVSFMNEPYVALNRFLLPPVLSPITSPKRHPRRRGRSHDEARTKELGISENGVLHACHKSQIDSVDMKNSADHSERGFCTEEGLKIKTVSCTSSGESQSSSCSDDDDGSEEDSEDPTDSEDDAEQSSADPETESDVPAGVLTEPSSSSCSDDEGLSEDGSSPSVTGSPGGESKVGAAGGSQPGFLDEFAAYEQDILLVEVDQEDPELFDNLPEQNLVKLGPTRVVQAAKTEAKAGLKPIQALSVQSEPRVTSGMTNFFPSSHDDEEESKSRPWRPHGRIASTEMQPVNCVVAPKQNRILLPSDALHNRVNGSLESSRLPLQMGSSTHNIPPFMSVGPGQCITNTASTTDFRRPKFKAYCRHYFSEAPSCGFKMCRFHHLPVEGDEKFCVENVVRFTNNPMCLQKAGAVYSGYYQNNPPGVYFSVSVFLALLWALLRAGMVCEVFSVLNVSVAHNIVPSHEFLLALFNYVREKNIMGFAPELLRVTFKMAEAGLELSLDCFDSVKSAPVFPQMGQTSSPHLLSSIGTIPVHLNLAHAIVEIELCIKQEDWRQVGEVFRCLCQSSHHPNQVERISGRVAIALLSECKDKPSLPFAAFAETACQTDNKENKSMSFVGRIGVSLMLRYYKTQHWVKGRRVVEMLTLAKINYTALKGLFGNEDKASRCCLVTVATELFLRSGSVEGALTTLRENKWFLSSFLWPCEPSDLEARTQVLVRLSGKTSHRDTLEVLSNLPGIKEPNDLIDISKYSLLFDSHLQVCVDRQILPVAADMADLMLSKKLPIDLPTLQVLLQKLGKQNLWLRAREVFRHSMNVGCYPSVSAPPGFMTLIVPCRLGEVELALAFEMFITANATAILHPEKTASTPLIMTLKRTQSSESEYLSAGSRVLSAACIPQPKLIVHYTAVNGAKEQMFTLDVASAQRWLRHNQLWASEVWAP